MAAEGTRTIADHPAGGAPDRSLVGLSARVRGALAVAALLVLLVVAYDWLRFLWGALHSPVGQYDFSTYYAAALALRHHPHANIYSQAVLIPARAVEGVGPPLPLPYTYPPLFAYLLIPFTFLSFHVAVRAWMAGNILIWLGCAALLAGELYRYLRPRLAIASDAAPRDAAPAPRAAGPTAWWARLVADPAAPLALALSAALCLIFAPAAQTLLLGQINFVVLLPLALVPWLTRTGHERWAGVAIASATMLKLTPGVLLLYLALRRRWEALIAAIVALVTLTLLSILLAGPSTFFALVPQALHVGTGDAALGQNEALFAPAFAALSSAVPGFAALARPLTYALLATLALAIGWVLWRAPRPVPTSPYPLSADYPAYAVALCAVVLLSPTAWVHHYLWLLPAAMLALMPLGDALRLAPGPDRRRAALLALAAVVACVLLALSLPNAWDTEPNPTVTLLFGLPLRPLALEARPIGALLVLLVAAALALRGGKVDADRARTG